MIMKRVCILTKNSRLSEKWSLLLKERYDVKNISMPDEIKECSDSGACLILHDDSEALADLSKDAFVLRSRPDIKDGEKLLVYGIKGYGNANMSDQVFIQAVDLIANGNIWLYPELLNHLVKKVNALNNLNEENEILKTLTQREKEVALLTAKGMSNHAIAGELQISESTVKLHISSIFSKLNIKSRVALALLVSKASG